MEDKITPENWWMSEGMYRGMLFRPYPILTLAGDLYILWGGGVFTKIYPEEGEYARKDYIVFKDFQNHWGEYFAWRYQLHITFAVPIIFEEFTGRLFINAYDLSRRMAGGVVPAILMPYIRIVFPAQRFSPERFRTLVSDDSGETWGEEIRMVNDEIASDMVYGVWRDGDGSSFLRSALFPHAVDGLTQWKDARPDKRVLFPAEVSPIKIKNGIIYQAIGEGSHVSAKYGVSIGSVDNEMMTMTDKSGAVSGQVHPPAIEVMDDGNILLIFCSDFFRQEQGELTGLKLFKSGNGGESFEPMEVKYKGFSQAKVERAE